MTILRTYYYNLNINKTTKEVITIANNKPKFLCLNSLHMIE